MFKYITYLFVFFVVVNISASAQTWSNPVRVIDPINGTGGDIGRYSKLLVVNGRPAMVYYDFTRNYLMYVRTTDASGSGWGTPVVIDSITAKYHFSFQVINGNPAISYYDATNKDLKYVRAADASGTTWNTPLTLDATGDVGSHTSLQTVNGNPAISYYDATNKGLKYVRAADASGTNWNTPLTIDATGDVGWYTSLQVVNGNPAISYYDYTNNDLKFIRASDISGTTWNVPLTLDVTGDVGSFTSLQIINGNPAIAYSDITNSRLKFIRAGNISGTAWDTPIIANAVGNQKYYPSLQLVNGNPAIAYYDITNRDLKYIRATTPSGTAWGASITVDATGDAGTYASLQVVNGNPAIAYYDANKLDLKYIRASDVSGVTWGVPINLDATGAIGQNISLNIVNGNPAFSFWNIGKGLGFVRAGNASGTVWDTPIAVDVTAGAEYNSLQIVNGNPAIAYVNNGSLKYIRATDPSGAVWGSPVTVDATPQGSYPSLQIVNGNPAIVYRSYDAVVYVRANNSSGTSWGTPVVIANPTAGGKPCLQVANGNPAIAYSYYTMYYNRASDASGTSWPNPIYPDNTVTLGGEKPSLEIINGNPAIAYYDYDHGDLRYISSPNVSGTFWNTPVTVDATGDVGQVPTLQIVSGKPAICYYDYSNGKIKYVSATDVSGTSWGAPVSLDAGYKPSMVSSANGVFIAYLTTNIQLPYFIYGYVSLTTDYFRTKDGGNWNDIATWESSHDGTNWYNATLAPDFTANTITILSGHKIIITEDVTIDQAIITSGAAVNVSPGVVLTINNGTGTDLAINSGGSLTVKSSASGEGSIGTSAGSISGNVTVERYFSNRRAWRLLGIPFSNSTQTIKAAWMEGATNSSDNPNNPFGTHITTFTGDPNAANFDAVKPASSIRIYASDKFTSDAAHTPNTTDKITDNDAYFLFVRGNRTVDRTMTTVTSTAILRITGTVTSGNVTKGLSGKALTLVPNPYPSAIDFNKVKTANTTINTFYVWDATLGGTNGVGQYRTIEITGAGPNYTYTATPGTSSTNWRFIESGTAFFIQGTAPVNFTETMKTSGTPPTSMLRIPSVNQTELAVNLNVINADNTISLADGVREVFDNNYSIAIDDNDAKKITGFGLNLGISSNSEILAIEKRPLPNTNDIISLSLSNTSQGNYQFELQPANLPAGLTPYLKDNHLDTYTPIDLTTDTKINFTVTADPASSVQSRFSIVFSKPQPNSPTPTIVIYPNPVQNGLVTLQMNNMPKGIYSVKLLNALGQTILTKQINHAEGSSTETFGVNKVKGAYMMEVTRPDNTKQNNKIIIN